MSISRKIPVGKWDAAAERVRGFSDKAKEVNSLIRNIENTIHEYHQELTKKGMPFTGKDLRDKYQGKNQIYKLALELFKEHNDKIYRLIRTGEYALGAPTSATTPSTII